MHSKTTIHGYLGRDPELTEKQGQNGTYDQVTFTVGVSRNYGDETDWYYCILNGKRAKTVDKFFSKGSQIIVEGRMESYKPKNDDKHTAWALKVTDFDFCDKKDSPRGANNPALKDVPKEEVPDTFEAAEDDIPF